MHHRRNPTAGTWYVMLNALLAPTRALTLKGTYGGGGGGTGTPVTDGGQRLGEQELQQDHGPYSVLAGTSSRW